MAEDILFSVQMTGVDAWIAQTSKLVSATNTAFASIKIPDLSLGNQAEMLKNINKLVGDLNKGFSGIKTPKIPENSMPSKPFDLATASLGELQKELNKTKANFSGGSTAYIDKLNEKIAQFKAEMNGVKAVKLPIPEPRAFNLATANVSELQKELTKLQKQFSGGDASYIIKVRERLKELKVEMGAVSKESFTEKLKGAFGGAIKEATDFKGMLLGAVTGGALVSGAMAIGSAVFNMGKFAINSAAQFESLRASLDVITGGTAAGGKLFQQFQTLASTSPFNFDDVAEQGTKLLAMGIPIEDVTNRLSRIGDIAAGVGREKLPSIVYAYGQIKAQGKAMAGDLSQFINAGVPIIEELAKVLGKPEAEIKKLASAGKIGFKEIDTALINMTSSGGKFFEMMKTQSNTFEGLWSSMEDSFQILGAQLGQLLLPTAKEIVITITELINKFTEFVQSDFGQKMAKDLGDATRETVAGFKFIISSIDKIKAYTESSSKVTPNGIVTGKSETTKQIEGTVLKSVVMPAPVASIITVVDMLRELGKVQQKADEVDNSFKKVEESYSQLEKGLTSLNGTDLSQLSEEGKKILNSWGFVGDVGDVVTESTAKIPPAAEFAAGSIGAISQSLTEAKDRLNKVGAGSGAFAAVAKETITLEKQLKVINDRLALMATSSNSLEGLQLRLSQMESKLRETSASSSTFDKLAQGIVKFKDEIEALQNRIKAFENVKGSINDLNFQIQIINNQINKQAPNSGLIPTLVAQSVALNAQIKETQNNIKRLEFNPKSLESYNFELSILNEKLQKQSIGSAETANVRYEIELLNNQIKLLNMELGNVPVFNSISGLGNEISDVQKKINELDTPQTSADFEHLKNLQTYILSLKESENTAKDIIAIFEKSAKGDIVKILSQPELDKLTELKKQLSELKASGDIETNLKLKLDVSSLENQIKSFEKSFESVSFGQTIGGQLVGKAIAPQSHSPLNDTGFTAPTVPDIGTDVIDSFNEVNDSITNSKASLAAFFEAMGATKIQSIDFADTLTETFKDIKNQAFQSLGNGLAETATMFGKGIGDMIMGAASFEDVLEQALISLGKTIFVEIPKVVGMGLVQAAFSPANIATFPASLPVMIPLLVGGLALLGLSGIASGVLSGMEKKSQSKANDIKSANQTLASGNNDIKSANQTLASGNVGATSSNSPMGLGGINGSEPVINTQMTVIIQNTGIDGIVLNTIQQQAFTQQRIK